MIKSDIARPANRFFFGIKPSAKGSITIRIVILILFLIPPMFVFAEDVKSTNEHEKIVQIVQKLQLRNPFPGEKVNKEETQVCSSFLEDFKAQRGIEFAEPIVKADDYNDPKLQAHLSKCPKLQLNKTVSFEPKIWDYAQTLPEEEREKIGRVWYTTLGFRLYHIDIDNNPKNGKEYIFYGAGNYSPKLPKERSQADSTLYRIADFMNCKIKDSKDVGDSINHLTKQPTENYNGILKYEGKYYIYDGRYSMRENSYSMYLSTWKKKHKKVLMVCTFTQNQTNQKKGVKNEYRTKTSK